jgi:lipopolysaccharide transport system permease protein
VALDTPDVEPSPPVAPTITHEAHIAALVQICDERLELIHRLDRAVRDREARIDELQRLCTDEQAVHAREAHIAELQRVCDERLELIHQLDDAAESRMGVIQRLEARYQERTEALHQIENRYRDRSAFILRLEDRCRELEHELREQRKHGGRPPRTKQKASIARALAQALHEPIETLKPVPQPRSMERILTTEVVIRPSIESAGVQLRELWHYRHLFMALVWRNVRVEFDATRLGAAWAVARPLLFAAVFAFFRTLSGANTHVEIPYWLYVYSGLLLWTYFTDTATNVAGAVRVDAALLTKVYYPRLLTPLVPTVAGLLTVAVGMVPLAIMMLWTGMRPGWTILLLPLVLIPCILSALGLGLLVSALSIENRDWERVLAYGMTIALWLSPVIYAPEMIPHGFIDVFHLNPMSGILMSFRAALFADVSMPAWEWVYSAVASVVLLLIGLWAFRKTELRMVDRL